MNEHECGLLTDYHGKGQPEVLGVRKLSQGQRVHQTRTLKSLIWE